MEDNHDSVLVNAILNSYEELPDISLTDNNPSLRKKCLYSAFFSPLFPSIQTEYGTEKLQIRTLFTQPIPSQKSH